MREEWKDIEGYEGVYQISNSGRIKRIKIWNGKKFITGEKILKPYLNGKNGKYLKITLHKDKKAKRVYVHRLMAQTYLGLK